MQKKANSVEWRGKVPLYLEDKAIKDTVNIQIDQLVDIKKLGLTKRKTIQQ